MSNADDVFGTGRRQFRIIYADPPWAYRDQASAGNRGAVHHYPVMDLSDLAMLPVGDLAADNCALFCWATFPTLPDALSVVEAWGFEYKTIAFTWVKRSKFGGVRWGMGNWTRANAEIVILATRGRPKRVSGGVHSLIESVPGRHSEKPAEARDRIVKLMGTGGNRIELFARGKVRGWWSWGNELGPRAVRYGWPAPMHKRGSAAV